MIHTDIYRNFNKEGFEFLLKRINIFYGKFTYLVIIKREGINKYNVVILSPKNNIRIYWKNFINLFTKLTWEKKWVQNAKNPNIYYREIKNPINWFIFIKTIIH